jgi:hypothetical protein
VQQSGYFTIEVASANRTPGDYRLNISAFEAIDNPSVARGVDILKGGTGVDTFNAGLGVPHGLAITSSNDSGTTRAGNTFTRTVNFNDPGGYSWMATMDYGEATGAVSLSPSQIDSVGQTLSLSHVYRKVGSYVVTVTLTNDDGLTDTKSFSVTVTASTATHFAAFAPSNSNAGASFSCTVTAFDAYGNVATGYTGTVHFTNTDGQATVILNSTLVSGVGMFTATMKTAGNQTLTATDTVTVSITGNTTVSVNAARAAHYAISAPASDVSGTSFNVTVTAIDAYGNVVTGYSGAVHFSSSDAQATLPPNSLLTNGMGVFPVTMRTAGNQILTGTDTNLSPLTQNATVSVLSATSTPKLISYSIQHGATERSYIRYLDLYFDTSFGLPNFANGIGINLIRYDINGLNPTVVLMRGLITISGTHVTIDFGINGISGNRLTNAGDGTYRLALDLKGDNSYSTTIQFTRLLGDVNGDATDLSLFRTYLKTKDINGDINGDGSIDREIKR